MLINAHSKKLEWGIYKALGFNHLNRTIIWLVSFETFQKQIYNVYDSVFRFTNRVYLLCQFANKKTAMRYHNW